MRSFMQIRIILSERSRFDHFARFGSFEKTARAAGGLMGTNLATDNDNNHRFLFFLVACSDSISHYVCPSVGRSVRP